MTYLSMVVGALIGMFLFTRLFRWILSKFQVQDPALSASRFEELWD